MQRGDADWEALRRRGQALYDVPPRAYHNWGHVEACLRELEHVRGISEDADTLELAIWFHDCVYDPQRHDNEERSADLAQKWLGESSLSAARIGAVADLILATKHNAIPTSLDAQLIVDIDLSILGQDTATFDAYERAIRQEYSFVPEDAFRTGRARILRSFLDRPSIYCTEPFRSRYEQPARENLSRSIQQLTGS